MDGIENARHDLFEAACSLETAIELLASIERDAESDATLRELVDRLSVLKEELDAASSRLPDSDTSGNSPDSDAQA
jgi:hypothetical protein